MIKLQPEYSGSDYYDPWQELALAIIRQAAVDYRKCGRKLKACEDEERRRELINEMESISRFFQSKWYCVLSNEENGPDILARLNEEVFGNDGCSEVS